MNKFNNLSTSIKFNAKDNNQQNIRVDFKKKKLF